MDKLKVALPIIIIIAIAAIAFVFFFSPQEPAEKSIEKIFEKNNLPLADFYAKLDSFTEAANDSQLNAISNDLATAKTASSAKDQALIEIYKKLVAFEKKQNQLATEVDSKLDTDTYTACTTLEEYELLDEKIILAVEEAEQLNSDINAFRKTYDSTEPKNIDTQELFLDSEVFSDSFNSITNACIAINSYLEKETEGASQ